MDTNNSAKCTGLRLPTTKELLTRIRTDVENAINSLRNADSIPAIRKILDQIYSYQIPNHNQIPANILGTIEDYRGVTRQVMMHTRTLDDLIQNLCHLLILLDESINEENKRERSNALSAIFKRLAENADTILEILENDPDSKNALNHLADVVQSK